LDETVLGGVAFLIFSRIHAVDEREGSKK